MLLNFAKAITWSIEIELLLLLLLLLLNFILIDLVNHIIPVNIVYNKLLLLLILTIITVISSLQFVRCLFLICFFYSLLYHIKCGLILLSGRWWWILISCTCTLALVSLYFLSGLLLWIGGNSFLSAFDASDWIFATTSSFFGETANLLSWNRTCLRGLHIIGYNCGHSTTHITTHRHTWSRPYYYAGWALNL